LNFSCVDFCWFEVFCVLNLAGVVAVAVVVVVVAAVVVVVVVVPEWCVFLVLVPVHAAMFLYGVQVLVFLPSGSCATELGTVL